MLKKLPLLVLLFFTCTKDRPISLSIKSCNLSYKKVQQQLPILQKKRASLYLQVRENDIGSDELKKLLHDAKEKNITIMLWPLLQREQGPWANEHNYLLFGKLVGKTTDWLKKEHIKPEYIVINMENGEVLYTHS